MTYVVADRRRTADGRLADSYATSEMLPTVWAVHDVPSVETLCRGVLRDLGLQLEPADHDDLLGWMLGEVSILLTGDPHSYCSRCAFRVRGPRLELCPRCESKVWRKPVEPYDPRRGVPFRLYAYGCLQRRTIDHVRSWRGRRGQKAVIDPRTVEAVCRDGGLDDPTPGGAGLEPDAGLGGDEACRADARGWLDPEGDLDGHDQVGGLGGSPDGRVAGRDARPGGRTVGGAATVAAGGGGDVPDPWHDCRCGHRNYLQAPNGRPDWHLDLTCVGCGAALLTVASGFASTQVAKQEEAAA